VAIAASALRERQWNIHRVVYCPGIFHLGSKDFKCWKVHNNVDFMGAMAWSCDVYFYNMGLKIGPDMLERTGREIGVGQKTGIDLPLENAGILPGREWKKKAIKVPWFDGDTVNYSIGQGFLTMTPLQAADYIATLTNGGTLWKPYVLDKVVDPSGQVVRHTKPQARSRIDMPPEVWKTVRRSMEAVVQTGTGRGIWRPDLVAGGKTGTAQNPHGEDHAWFVCYAGKPGEEAGIVVAVIVEHGGHGATAAVPVARAVVNAFYPLPEKPAPKTAPGAGVSAPAAISPTAAPVAGPR
jgi:penicillin-binding protein 2